MDFNAGMRVISESAIATGAGAGVGYALASSNPLMFGAACGLTYLVYNLAKAIFNVNDFFPKFAILAACSFAATVVVGFNLTSSLCVVISGIAIGMLMKCGVSAVRAGLANTDF